MKSINEMLKDLREDKDLTQRDIAKLLGTTQQYYSKYESGHKELPIRHLITLADFYKVPADLILGRIEYAAVKADNSEYTKWVKGIADLSPENKKAIFDYIELLKLKDKKQ
ncbi:MAG: helix-turn-helix domain-containing protein [Oscillospiraceae bacterium]|jgi:transcriptional regulator with XRE-family HTH domain|nr:helix-turn-helix domain-containing protein [Oscillospiraceae bacterium]